MKYPILTKALLAGLLLPAATWADEADDREAVIATVQAFFESMTARDVDRMRALMTPDGMIFGYREVDGETQITRIPHADYLSNLASGEGTPVERFWDPEVTVYGRLATVWTPYDFYLDGQYSHCGVNIFSMLKTNAGWIIAGVVFSIERDCDPSPLGPYGEQTGGQK